MKKTIQRLRNERGLTLVELLAVIVILAIVAVIAFVMIGNVMENARKDAHISNAQQLIASAKLYDATEETVTSIDSDKLYDDGYLDKLINPWDSTDATYKGTVTKTDGVFSVKITGGDKVNCNLNKDNVTEEFLAGERDTVCQ